MQISDQGLLKTQAYVDGKWINADSGDTLAVINPATGHPTPKLPKGAHPQVPPPI